MAVFIIFGGLIMGQKWNAPINPAIEKGKTSMGSGHAKKALAGDVFWMRGDGAAGKPCRHNT